MAHIKTFITITALALLVSTADAQTRKRRATRKAQPAKVEPTPEELLYADMLGSTAQVTFIDSVVTDRADFLKAIPLDSGCGTIARYNDFFHTTGQDSSLVCVNGMGNRAFFAKTGDDGVSRLYATDKLAGSWAGPVEIKDFDGELHDMANPFLMPDGLTLYFAARGDKSVGGRDIFVTMYDTHAARFYKPENIGLPYNSGDDDLLYVVDELNCIGWLVTARRQPAGKVCVYAFIPSATREAYDAASLGEDTLKSLAAISSIGDTWTDRAAVAAARQRLAALKARAASGSDIYTSEAGGNAGKTYSAMPFHISDDVIYTSPADFRTADGRRLYARLVVTDARLAALTAELDALRRQYHAATAAVRRTLSPRILAAERQSEALSSDAADIARDIRIAERRGAIKN